MPAESDGGAEAPSAADGARNQGNGGRGGRGRPNNRRWNARRGQGNQDRVVRSVTRFEGREPSLKGHIYDLPTEFNQDQFVKTTKEIKNYVGRTYREHTGEFTKAVDDLEIEDPEEPEAPEDPEDRAAFETWKWDTKDYREKVKAVADFKAGLYNIVIGQCTEGLEQRINSHQDIAEASGDGIALLLIVRAITHAFEDRSKSIHQIVKLKKKLYGFTQGNMALIQYHDMFLSRVQALKLLGATFTEDAIATEIANENGREDHNDADRAAASDMALALMFLEGAHSRYGDYLASLSNEYLQGDDRYPTTLQQAYLILDRWEGNRARPSEHRNDGIVFATTGSDRGASRPRPDITCFNCQQQGHFANQCPNRDNNENGGTDGVSAVMGDEEKSTNEDGFSFSQGEKSPIPEGWLLLDNQSTDDIIKSKTLLRNIRTVTETKRIRCNAGVTTTNQVGDLPGYGTVWYQPNAIANIVSLSKVVSAGYHVKFDSDEGNKFTVTKPCGKVMVFEQAANGLFYLDTTKGRIDAAGVVLAGAVPTVDDNKLNYSNDDYLRAKQARAIQIRIGRPTTKDFARIVRHNLLPNCPITVADINAAEDIFGPDLGSLKGKTVRRSPHKVNTNDIVRIPLVVHERYREVTICGDIMHVNGQPILATISRHLRFGTMEALTSKGTRELLRAIDSVAKAYREGGFIVRTVLLDGEFESLRGDLAARGIHLNGVGRDEHVGEAERFICTIKERVRATYSTLPFKKVPMRVVIEMVYDAVFWWNAFPKSNGVSETLSPRTIVTGRNIDYNRHCKFTFGEYVQAHEQHDNQVSVMRTTGALARQGNMGGLGC